MWMKTIKWKVVFWLKIFFAKNVNVIKQIMMVWLQDETCNPVCLRAKPILRAAKKIKKKNLSITIVQSLSNKVEQWNTIQQQTTAILFQI